MPNTRLPASFCTATAASAFIRYVEDFVTTMTKDGAGPDILCMDHYPFFEFPDGSNSTVSVAGYRANLGILREASLEIGVPFWNFFNDVGWATHSDPTEAQMRWQVFTSLA